ncbi:MAG: MFS transporter, partial [Candidatus Marinimicrobia bacterium]|nr:MFS transporter [Candidatus Neomarinimicrobiota bacterium]
VTILLFSLVRRRPEDIGLLPDGAATPRPGANPSGLAAGRSGAEDSPAAQWTAKDALRTKAFWLVGFTIILSVTANSGIGFNMVPYIREQAGISIIQAAGVLSLSSFLSLANLVWAYLADKFTPRRCIVGAMASTTGIIVYLFMVNSLWSAYVFGIAWGLFAGGMDVLIAMVVAQYFGRESYGTILGALRPFEALGLGLGLLALGLALFQPAAAQVADDFKQYTSVNQMGIGLTNFGVLGNGYNRIGNEIQPSGQYKQHSQVLREQVEHFSYAGLWVGGIVNGQPLVSTSIVDGVLESGSEGWEFLPLAPLTIKSSLVTDRYYNPTAVSHQDFTTRYTDIFPPEATIPKHTPLGIEVTQRSFAWDFSFADAFVIFEYTITNVNLADTIYNIYAGIWMDASIANMNYTSTYTPGGGFTWYDNLDGYDETIDDGGFQRFLSYQYDDDGDDGWAESYIAVKTLGGTVPQPYLRSFFTQWVWTSSNNTDYPRFNLALTDPDRYSQLSTPAAKIQGPDVDPQQYKADGYPADPNSWLFMHSAGPLGSLPAELDSSAWKLPPGDSLTIVFAIIGARWASGSDDSPKRRANLYVNADWAQKTYDGEDVNRNNVLDPGENKNDDPALNRYILPEPPLAPRVYLDIRSQQVDIYWARLADDSIDPISAQKDFEGYRIYGARKTAVETQLEELSL